MNAVKNLGILQMAAAYIFIVILLFIVRRRGINREKEILISTLRMTVQLILLGYVLTYVFNNVHPLYTILIIVFMEVFAIHNTFKRVRVELTPKLKKTIVLSLGLGTLTSLAYFLIVVVSISPWYDPRYFIPIAGMLVGNSMTGISLGTVRLVDSMKNNKHLVENALMMGATPKAATRDIVNNAFDSAILPTINSMVGMGIVSLPGMMTGQILSGTPPLTAIEYQIAIMLGILGSVSLTVILFVQMGYKTFFNKRLQLDI